MMLIIKQNAMEFALLLKCVWKKMTMDIQKTGILPSLLLLVCFRVINTIVAIFCIYINEVWA